MKEVIVNILKKVLKEKDLEIEDEKILSLIEKPKDYTNGDYSFPCFVFAKDLKIPPHQIAIQFREEIGNPPLEFKDIQAVGPYLNFYLDRKNLAINLIQEIKREKDEFGQGTVGKKKKMVVEFSSPNIAKPFGIGHLRSTIIGNAIANIAMFQGFKVKKINYYGDWGTQFGKLITGFIEFGDQNKLKKDPIRHLYEIYVKVNKDKKYDEESREWFKKLEEGDKEAVTLWKKFSGWSLEEFNEIYTKLGIKFDDILSESLYNNKMKKVVEELEEKKLIRTSKGARIVSLKKEKLGVVLIQKSDGATLYATRDLASAIDRYKKDKFDYMIYEVGQEQKLHFKQLFKVLEKMGYAWAKNCVHVDHGLYLGKNGKKMATRKGKTIFMEDILDDTEELASVEIKKRFPNLSEKELKNRSRKVAIAAIFYGDLKNNRSNDVVFDLERFVSFEGDTGPYLLYSYARASSILKKVKKIEVIEEFEELEEKELGLVLKLNEFKQICAASYNSMNPSVLANYSYKLAQAFNEFYHACPVLESKRKNFRLQLVESFIQILKNSLILLGIEPLEEM